MSWKIRFIEKPELHDMDPVSGSEYYRGTVKFEKMEIGDLCFYHYQGVPCFDGGHLVKLHLTQYYFANNSKRPPLILALPDKAFQNGKLYFLVDGQCYSQQCLKCGVTMAHKCKCGEAYQPKGYYDGWTVAGDPPMITVSPSVNYDTEDSKHYHGFVQNGVVGDG